MLVELLAPMLRWPLYSPRRLGLVLTALVTALVMLATVTGGGSADTGSGTTPRSPTTTTPASGQTATPTTGTNWLQERTGTEDPGTDAAPDQDVAAAAAGVVVAFVTAWAQPDLPADVWLTGLVDVTDPAYLEQLATTDPANVASTAVTGPAQPIVSGAFYSEVLVPTDAGDLTVRVTYDGIDWRVVSVRPIPPGAGTE